MKKLTAEGYDTPIFPNDMWYLMIEQDNRPAAKIVNNTLVSQDPYSFNMRSKYKIYPKGVHNGYNHFVGPFNSIFECKLYKAESKYNMMKRFCKDKEYLLVKEDIGYYEEEQKATFKSYIGELKKLQKLLDGWHEKYPEYFV